LDGPHAAEAVAFASENQTLLLGCGTDKETSLVALRRQQEAPKVIRAFVGVHPSEASKENDVEWVKTVLQKAAGIGEIGLDPKYSSIEEGGPQSKTFRTLLEFAEVAQKPVQVHSRGAESRCLQTLSEFDLKKVLMHWFANEMLLDEVLKGGYFISFGPAILYSKKLQQMATLASHDLVLVETDAPVPYTPLMGASGPSLVPSVIFKLAELWGTSFDEARVATVMNAAKFLGLPGKVNHVSRSGITEVGPDPKAFRGGNEKTPRSLRL
jgi:TatD DNase family protein